MMKFDDAVKAWREGLLSDGEMLGYALLQNAEVHNIMQEVRESIDKNEKKLADEGTFT